MGQPQDQRGSDFLAVTDILEDSSPPYGIAICMNPTLSENDLVEDSYGNYCGAALDWSRGVDWSMRKSMFRSLVTSDQEILM